MANDLPSVAQRAQADLTTGSLLVTPMVMRDQDSPFCDFCRPVVLDLEPRVMDSAHYSSLRELISSASSCDACRALVRALERETVLYNHITEAVSQPKGYARFHLHRTQLITGVDGPSKARNGPYT